MKILIVTPPMFHKNRGAAQKETLGNVELLKSMGHDVVLYAISTGYPHEIIARKEVSEKLGIEVRIFKPNLKNWLHWIYSVIFKHFTYADRASYVFAQLVEDKEFLDFIKSWKPELIFSFCCFSWPVLRFAKQSKIPSVFRSHNYEANFYWESLKFRQMFYPQNWIRYIAKAIEERNSVIYSDATAALHFTEIKKYYAWSKNIFILTVTFPYKSLQKPFIHRSKKPIDLFYLGASYGVVFHLLGAKALIEDIAPEVLKIAPDDFRFHICGGSLPKYLQEKCDGKKIIYEGYVEDFEEFMSRMDAGSFPTWTGTTIKGKVCETLCRAFPLVIPKNCLGNYDLIDNKEILLADTKELFVESILRLKDEELREKLSKGAATFAERNFSQQTLTKILGEIIDVAKKHSLQSK